MERALLDWVTQAGNVVGSEMVRWLVSGEAPHLPAVDVGWARASDGQDALRW